MREDDKDAILPRRYDVCMPLATLATHITQLALTATILTLCGCDRALSQVNAIPAATLSV